MGQIIDFSSVKREREREGRGRGGEQFEKEFVKKAVNFQMSRGDARVVEPNNFDEFGYEFRIFWGIWKLFKSISFLWYYENNFTENTYRPY